MPKLMELQEEEEEKGPEQVENKKMGFKEKMGLKNSYNKTHKISVITMTFLIFYHKKTAQGGKQQEQKI